jgi:phosphomevalonate kinase
MGDALESALLASDFGSVREVVGELHRLLCSLGPVENDGIRRIVALARTEGSAAKVSGAGGGDGCIVFSKDEEAQTALCEALSARGIVSFPLHPEPGLLGEVQDDAVLARWLAAAG